ncbi:MAG TPA: hypothetical protein DEH78_20360, partial [Solibacterales bacterium]|nr:hypothetical protein [Bryobacterales bacterium]
APPPAPPATMGFRSTVNTATAGKLADDARLALRWRWERQTPGASSFQPLAARDRVPPAAVLRLIVTSPGGGTLLLRRGAETLMPLSSVIGPAGTLESRYVITADQPETLRLELRENDRLTQFEIPVPLDPNR